MKKIEINEDGNKVLKMEAKCFIIPNSLFRVKNLLSDSVRTSMSESCSRICELNGEEFNPDAEYLVQLWFHSDDVDSDNVCRHGFGVMDGDESRWITPRFLEHIPCKIFDGKKEGDTFTLKVPYDDMVIELTLTLNQLDYRYRQYGPFEKTLKKLLATV